MNHEEAGSLLDACLSDALSSVRDLGCDERISRRYDKFRKMGEFEERANPPDSRKVD